MRTFAVLACATTLSLFTTIVAYAAVNVAPLKWDGSFCSAKECGFGVRRPRRRHTQRIALCARRLPRLLTRDDQRQIGFGARRRRPLSKRSVS